MFAIIWREKKMKKTKKQLIKELQQQVHDLEVKLDTQNDILQSNINALLRDLEVRKFKEKSKGEKYIVNIFQKLAKEPFYTSIETILRVSFLDEQEENVIEFKTTLPKNDINGIDHKVNENYVELYSENEIIMVYKITDIKLERVDLELYKKAYPYSVNLKKNVCECNNKIVDFMAKEGEEKLKKLKEELKNLDMSSMPKEDIRVIPRKIEDLMEKYNVENIEELEKIIKSQKENNNGKSI